MSFDDDFDEDERPTPPDESGGAFRETLITLVTAVALAFIVQAVLVKPYRIPSGSMEHTLMCQDRVLVDRVTGHWDPPERGDVIVFHPPAAKQPNGTYDMHETPTEGPGKVDDSTPSKETYIKRLVGMPGETISVKDGHAYINGKKLDEPYLNPEKDSHDLEPYKIPAGHYFMLGDHRAASEDSRYWGALPQDNVIGKAFIIYWPLSRFGTLPKKDPGGENALTPDPKCPENFGG